MASLQKKGDSFYCQFLYKGKRKTFTIGKVSEDEALNKVSQVDYLLMRLKQGYLSLPSGIDIVTFVQKDGQVSAPEPQDSVPATTLKQLQENYFTTYSNGAVEASSLDTSRIHFAHLAETLGDDLLLSGLSVSDLQQHVSRRAKDVAAVTIKKEIATLRAAWNWGVNAGLITGIFPNKGLVFPKSDEKLPFMTWQEIERRIAGGGDPDELWDCLYLTVPEIESMLVHVKNNARHDFVYPMFCFAAYTGARRSEIIRAEVQDVDFDGSTVMIREKKRAKGKRTMRRVPLTPSLKKVLRKWLKKHPGCPWLFCSPLHIPGSRKRRLSYCPLTVKEVWGHFLKSLAGSKWEVLKGWHVLRHSFISNCASKGVDQRLIDEWVGHTTEEMRKRYRHLLPSIQQKAIQSVFG